MSKLEKIFLDIAGTDRLISKVDFRNYLKQFDGYKPKRDGPPRNVKQFMEKLPVWQSREGVVTYPVHAPRDGFYNLTEIGVATYRTGIDFQHYYKTFYGGIGYRLPKQNIDIGIDNIYAELDSEDGGIGELTFAEFQKIKTGKLDYLYGWYAQQS